MNIDHQVIELLKKMGRGYMSSNAYDTAWVARLKQHDPHLADRALKWLRNHQLADGTWGTEHPAYYHDRLVCTLSAMLALAENGDEQDTARIERARDGLRKVVRPLADSSVIETIAAELLIPALLQQAEELGIIERWEDSELQRLDTLRQAKLQKLPSGAINRHITLAFTSEIAGKDADRILDVDNLQEPNGSVADSPAATAYYALQISPGDKAALAYLNDWLQEDGGIQNAAPIDVFEVAWILRNIDLIDNLPPEIMTAIQPHLQFLQRAWDDKAGCGFAANYLVKDGDGTSMVLEVLKRFDQPICLDTMFTYEQEDYFRCFALEVNPSISTNIHILGALRQAGLPADHPSVQKIVRFLWDVQYWFDKWHVSPYYPTAHAIIAMAGYLDDIVSGAIDWMIESQNDDGSWGYFGATAEETAYCLQALVVWKNNGYPVDDEILQRGADWLKQHVDDPYPPMWIGKCLYTPVYVVESTVLSALKMVEQVLRIAV